MAKYTYQPTYLPILPILLPADGINGLSLIFQLYHYKCADAKKYTYNNCIFVSFISWNR